jgi:hypothetical protein
MEEIGRDIMFRNATTLAICLATMGPLPARAGDEPSPRTPMTVAQDNASRETEGPLRKIIGELQRGAPDTAGMEPALQSAVQAQAPAIAAMLGSLGTLRAIDFIGVENGTDAYRATFQNGSVNWFIRMSPAERLPDCFSSRFRRRKRPAKTSLLPACPEHCSSRRGSNILRSC